MRADLKRLKRELDSGASSSASTRAAESQSQTPSASAINAAVYRRKQLAGVAASSSSHANCIPANVLAKAAGWIAGSRPVAESRSLDLSTRRARAPLKRFCPGHDFNHTTGDLVFDGTLKQALAVSWNSLLT